MNAYVNHGRWVAECDTPYCGAAYLVDTATRRRCDDCGRTYPVVFPAERGLIDAALRCRLVPATRNWLPGETVADLVAENDAHANDIGDG